MTHGGVEGVLLCLEAFAWCFEPRDKENVVCPGQRALPMVLWADGERAVRSICGAITEGHDLLLDKTRDTGATWDMDGVFWAYWLNRPGSSFLLSSRKEEYVDKRGDPKTLMWKVDWLNNHLPGWLLPKIERTHLHLGNLDNGSVIDGESTNPDMARGDRRLAIGMDEFSSVEQANQVLAATADAADARLFVGTPKGTGHYDAQGNLHGNCFGALRFCGRIPIITLHWSNHPVKGKDKRRIWREGKIVWTSPWYERECARRASRQEIAQELDIDYLGSGDMFFDSDVLQAIRLERLRKPSYRGDIKYETKTLIEGVRYKLENVRWETSSGGCAEIYEDLYPDIQEQTRPRQERNYVAFADISLGTGASNSTLEVICVDTGEQIFELADSHASPEKFARDCVAVCLWVGGQVDCLFGWEANGPGEIFGREVCRLGYKAVYGNTDTSLPWEPNDSQIGWHSDRNKKLRLFGDLRGDLARSEVIVHGEPVLVELEQCINYPSGGVGPSHLVEEPEGARAAHGDRNISLAGAAMLRKAQPRYKFEEPGWAPDSIEGRIEMRRRERDRAAKAEQW